MLLEDYFLFLSEDDIRIKGHRIGIDNVLFYFLEGYNPEEIIKYQLYAQYQLRLNQQININISEDDLEKLQTLAESKEISCQDLIVDILHKYATGVAVEI